MKNSKSKKIVSLLLAGCISASMMSVTAWAEKIEGGGILTGTPTSQTEETECNCGAAEGELYKEGCPLYVAPVPEATCTMDENCTAEEHKEGCPKAEPKDETPNLECNCGAAEGELHKEGCPLYVAPVPETTCTGDENCTAEEHKEGCPKAEPKDETPELECNCGVAEGEAHKEGCPLYTVPAPETPVVPKAVQLAMEKIASLIDFVDHTEEQIPATDGTTVTKIRVPMLEKLDPAKDEELKELIAREEAALRDETQPALTEEEAARLEQARSAFESAKEQYLTDAFSDAHLAANTAFEALTADQQAQVENASQLADINENLAYIMQAVNTLPVEKTLYKELKTVILAGANVGNSYNPDSMSFTDPAYQKFNNETATWADWETTVFSFEAGLSTGKTSFPFSSPMSQKVQNQKDERVWECVGFIPVSEGRYDDYRSLGDYIYVKEKKEGRNEGNLTEGTKETAQQLVQEKGGILYGETPTKEQMEQLNNKVKNKELYLMCVWYAGELSADSIVKNNYGQIEIPAVSAIDYQPTSTGVSLSCGEVSQTSNRLYTLAIDVTVTIDASAPDQIHVNLNDVLGEAMEKFSNFHPYNELQPGDHMTYHIHIENQSGREYQYTQGSVQLGTVPMTDGNNLGTGFDGYTIYGKNENGKSMIPYRTINAALKILGISNTDLSDEAIGTKLKATGYGTEEMSSEEVTQKYLSHYYLDYINNSRKEGEKVHSFGELSMQELRNLFFTEEHSNTEETCSEVADAFYYIYYGEIFTANEKSFYDWMQDNSSLDQSLRTDLGTGNSFVLSTKLEGAAMGNAFQNTRFGFGMQFDMNIPAPTPDPDPDPTPDPDPNPKDEGGEPDPDPRPRTTIDDEPTPRTNRPETVAIEDSEVPLTDAPELVTIDDEQVPLKDNPETGDASSALPSLAAAALSLTGLAVLCKKKKQ